MAHFLYYPVACAGAGLMITGVLIQKQRHERGVSFGLVAAQFIHSHAVTCTHKETCKTRTCSIGADRRKRQPAGREHDAPPPHAAAASEPALPHWLLLVAAASLATAAAAAGACITASILAAGAAAVTAAAAAGRLQALQTGVIPVKSQQLITGSSGSRAR